MRLSARTWAAVLLVGMVLPVALYLGYVSTPLAHRDTSIVQAAWPFSLGAGVCVLWLLLVPGWLAAAAVWRRHLAAGVITVASPRRLRLQRTASVAGTLVWLLGITPVAALLSFMTLHGLLIEFPLHISLNDILLIFDGVEFCMDFRWYSPLGEYAQQLPWAISLVLVLIGLAMLPAAWERRRPEWAGHYVVLARTLLPVYGVLIVFCVALYGALYCAERGHMARDRVVRPGVTADMVAMTESEGRMVRRLQRSILRNAAALPETAPRKGE